MSAERVLPLTCRSILLPWPRVGTGLKKHKTDKRLNANMNLGDFRIIPVRDQPYSDQYRFIRIVFGRLNPYRLVLVTNISLLRFYLSSIRAVAAT
jgi:hypothetical protein